LTPREKEHLSLNRLARRDTYLDNGVMFGLGSRPGAADTESVSESTPASSLALVLGEISWSKSKRRALESDAKIGSDPTP
jgi:hypothetical protein